MEFIFKYINSKSYYCEIYENVWLGNYKSACDTEFMNKIDVVLNCTDSLPFSFNHIQNHRISIPEISTTNDIKSIESYLEMTSDLIASYLKDNKCILVHCDNAIQRSCSIVIAYIIKYKDMDLYTATDFLITKHKFALSPYPYYNIALVNYEYNINKKNSNSINFIHLHKNIKLILITLLVIYLLYKLLNIMLLNKRTIQSNKLQ